MAESPLIDTKNDLTIAQHVAKLSDRAIQRITGGNAFLRGRLYARRNAVVDLNATGTTASAKILVRADQPYETQLGLTSEGQIISHCSCPAWRGPTGHCKHVAAVLVALRDRERPPRPKGEADGLDNDAIPGPAPIAAAPRQASGSHAPVALSTTQVQVVNAREPLVAKAHAVSSGSNAGSLNNGSGAGAGALALLDSAGGKRRRSRRRRRTNEGPGAPQLEIVSSPSGSMSPAQPLPQQSRASSESRGSLEAWLPPHLARPSDLEFRLAVRPASIAVTAVLAGTRQAVSLNDALTAFNGISSSVRPLIRDLARHTTRSAPATAEVRGEDAADILSRLKGRRVLLEPSSMELRFTDEPLRPKIELDSANGNAVRIRVVFELPSTGRRFPLSSGAWFEGTPGWYLDTTEGVARPVAENVTPAWLQRLYRSPALVHPIHDLPHVLTEFLPRVAASLSAALPDLESVADVIDITPHFALRATGDLVEARARLQASYREHCFDVPPRDIPPPLSFVNSRGEHGRPSVVRREVGLEMAGVQELLNHGFEVDGTELVVRGDKAIAFWTYGISTLPETWDRFIPNDLAGVQVRKSPVMARVRVSSGVEWLNLDMVFGAEGVAVSEEELRMCLAEGKKLVRLEDGTYAPIKADDVGQVLERMAEIFAGVGDDKRVPLSQAGRVQELLRIVSDQNVHTSAKSLFGKLEDLGEIESVAKPRSLRASLRPYQKDGFSWLAFLHNLGTGGILADDMGLGKTVQAIALLLWAKSKAGPGLTLVVAPTSVVPNWQREIEKFAPSFKTVLWQGPDRQERASELEDADVMITSYALLRRDEEFLHTLQFRYVILDEAQHIKNPMSATARAAKRLKSERRLAMTGTPIENRLSEIWSIFDFVSPGLLNSLNSFEEKYARPIERGDAPAAVRLRATIHPFVLRRTKSEVAKDLPEKIIQEMVVPMSEEQSKLYKQILRQVRESVMSEVEKQGIQKSSIQILAALTRLRQVACDPRLLGLDGNFEEESGKLNALKEIVSEAAAGGHKVLIFSQFVSMLKLIKEALEAEKITYTYLDGSTKDRQSLVDEFNTNESITVFLISLKAGGTGLNLTGADTVIHFDPWWNPAVEDQATDRAHRIGQTKVVNVYRLVAKSSVEEKILQLSDKKRELVANVLSTEDVGL
ncbi:MAG: Helicase, family, partial [Myxococcaceae bacterium]|nr:Helicase, family [Myxococcaceae bacterium]